jgi:hypothetical protein
VILFDRGVVRSPTVDVTFVGIGSTPTAEPSAEGLVRMPDGTLQPLSGWIDILAALERITTGNPVKEHVAGTIRSQCCLRPTHGTTARRCASSGASRGRSLG